MPTLNSVRTVKNLGSTKWWIKEVKADGTDLNPADTYALGYLRGEHEISISLSTETKNDEGGNAHTLQGSREAKLTLTLLENHAGAWNFLQAALLQEKTFAIVVQRVGSERGGNHNGKYEYQFFPICRIAGDVSTRLPGTDLQVTFALYPAPAQITQTLDSTELPGYEGAASSATVPAGQFASPVVEVNPT